MSATGLLSGCAGALRPSLQEQRMFDHIVRVALATPALASQPEFVRAVAAERTLRRGDFVPRRTRGLADIDTPVDIGAGQTISDPYIVAVMTAAAGIRPGSRVLEIGTGSGYQAAVLARLGARVSTIEIVPVLARRAAATLRRLRLNTVATRLGDGFAGWPEHAPFDAIIVTAGVAAVPEPLVRQLAPGGRIVVPLGSSAGGERLVVLTAGPDGRFTRCLLGPAAFVPFTGAPARALSVDEEDGALPFCYGRPVT